MFWGMKLKVESVGLNLVLVNFYVLMSVSVTVLCKKLPELNFTLKVDDFVLAFSHIFICLVIICLVV